MFLAAELPSVSLSDLDQQQYLARIVLATGREMQIRAASMICYPSLPASSPVLKRFASDALSACA